MQETEIPEMIKAVFTASGDHLYYKLSNSDGKVWYISDYDCSLALQLYQPSSRKGKLLKISFPVIRHFPVILLFLGITSQKYSIKSSLFILLLRLFKVENIQISIFCGTPSSHQKLTIQVSNGSKILGYCKLTRKGEIKNIFNHEESILNELIKKDVTEIPHCLFNGEWQNEINLFVQTTNKTKRSKVGHELSAIHLDFLNQLHQKTKTRIPFEQSDFYQSLQFLKQGLQYVSAFDTKRIHATIKIIENHYCGKQVEFSMCHSDFTPWNMFVENEKLFVFDWEYSERTFPPYLDVFHFFTQTSIFVLHKDHPDIFRYYQLKKPSLELLIDNPDVAFQCYLLHVISHYIQRDKENLSEYKYEIFNIWIGLLERLQK